MANALLTLGVISVICAGGGIIYYLREILTKQQAIIEKPAGKTTYMGAIGKYDPKDEVTTTIPIPIHAATCDHDWEVVSDNVLDMDHEKRSILVMACRSCGMIDKTTQVTSTAPPPPPPPKPIPPPPCKHDWIVKKDVVLEMPHEKKALVLMTCTNCGEIKESKEVTSKIPSELMSPKSECRHDWMTDKRVTLDSAYEQMAKAHGKNGRYYSNKTNKELDLDYDRAPPWMFRKSYVLHRTCSKCGQVYTIIASNFDEAGDKEAADCSIETQG